MIAVNSPAGNVALTPSSAITAVGPEPYTLRSSTAWAAGAPACAGLGNGHDGSPLSGPSRQSGRPSRFPPGR